MKILYTNYFTVPIKYGIIMLQKMTIICDEFRNVLKLLILDYRFSIEVSLNHISSFFYNFTRYFLCGNFLRNISSI